MQSKYELERGSGLKKAFSFHDALMFGITVAMGSGILFAAAGATKYAGPGEIISWIMAVIMLSILVVPYAEYGAMFPKSGMSSRIGMYTVGSYGGFISGWGLFLWEVLIPPLEAVAVATYASYYVPSLYDASTGLLTSSGVVLAIVITLLFFGVNGLGLKAYGRLNDILTWFKVLAIAAVMIFMAVTMFKVGNLSNFLPYGAQGIFIAIPAAGILFAFGGYRQVADMAGEIKNPRKNVPRAVLSTLAVQSVLYVAMGILIVGIVNWKSMGVPFGNWQSVAALGSPAADLMKGNLVAGTALYPIGLAIVSLVLIFAVISPLATFGGSLVAGSRIIYGFTVEGALPKIFTKLNKRGSPMYSLALAAIIAVLFIIPIPSWYILADFVVVSAAVTFAITSISLPISRKLYPDVNRPFKVPFPMVWGFVAFIFAGLLIYWATYPVTLYALGATLAGTLVYIPFMARNLRREGKPLNLKASIWVPFYIIGLLILSYLGASYSGGTNLIPYPLDMITVVIYSIIFYVIGLLLAPKKPILSESEIKNLQGETIEH